MEWRRVKIKLSESQIEQVENELKVHLPDDYKKTIGNINGGGLKNAYVVIDKNMNIPYSSNISLSKDSSFSVFNLFTVKDITQKHLFPFGSVGNGDYFCFNLDNNRVVLYCHETEKIIDLCDSFTTLIKMIRFNI